MPESSIKKIKLADIYPLIQAQLDAGGCASFTIHGISMSPMLKDGVSQVRIASAVLPLKKYDIPFYRRADGAFVLHRIISVKSGKYTCRGDHQLVKERNVTDDMIIGVLEAYTKKNGEWKLVSSLSQRIYARIYVNTAYIRVGVRLFPSNVKRLITHFKGAVKKVIK